MESSQLEVMSEYLVMAAQLIEMKSKMLLPKEKVQIEESIKKIQEKHSLEDLLNIKI
ncbi:MAG: segregation/condensation protein A [Faecalibacillus sp.]